MSFSSSADFLGQTRQLSGWLMIMPFFFVSLPLLHIRSLNDDYEAFLKDWHTLLFTSITTR